VDAGADAVGGAPPAVSAALPLETQRLLLRDARESDFAAVHAYASDPEVTRFTGWGPNAEAETHAFLAQALAAARAEPRSDFGLLVEQRADLRVVGGCGIRTALREREWEIGYVFAREAWGRGLATETVRALVAFGFESLGAHRLRAGVFPGNGASARVLEKLGFTCEGQARRTIFARGEWHDERVFALLEDEWRIR
jgi:RimJ/RimL family protein N-acetyltransferase